MADLRSLARHLRDSVHGGRTPKVEAADAKLWYLALAELIRRGDLDTAAGAAADLMAAFPESAFIRRIAFFLDRMPPAAEDPDFARFMIRDDLQLQVAPRNGASTCLLAFCGRHGSLGMPVPIAHRWFGGLDVHVVYLRDPQGYLYVDGLPALAGDRPGTLAALRRIVDQLQSSRIVCYGNSNGGFAALLYGLELPAVSVLATNAVTIFPDEIVLSRFGRHAGGPDRVDLSLASAYAAASARPRVRLVHGADDRTDAASANMFAGLRGVSIQAVSGSGDHDAHVPLMEHGHFGTLLKDFVAGWPDEVVFAAKA